MLVKPLDFAYIFWAFKYDRDDLTTPVAGAATAQVKLCPYDEVEPHICFCLITAQFAAARIRSKKTQIHQRTCQPAQASPPGHFRHTRCLQRFRWALRLFETHFAWPIWEEQMAVLFQTTSPPHGNAGPQAYHSHEEAQTTSPSRSFTWKLPLYGNVSHLPTTFHVRSGR